MKNLSWMAAAGVAMMLTAGGCQPKSAAPPAMPPVAQAPVDPEHTSLPASTQPIDTAQAIASKAASYSQDMARMIEQRDDSDDRTLVNGGGAADSSQVKWLDADEFRLADAAVSSNHAADLAQPAAAEIVADSSPAPADSAEQVASITPVHAAPQRVSAPAAAPAPAVNSDVLAAGFAQRIHDYPNDIAAHLDHQLLLFLNDRQVPDLASLASLPEEDRELVTTVLDGLSNFRNAIRADNNMLLSRKVQPMLQMADRLRSQADLYIPAIALCTKVDGFGIYKVIDPPRFVAGREHPAIVYCEIANFASQLNDQKLWETRLVQEAVLYTETGLPVWQDSSKTITDVCRNRRHDFFMVKMIKLPSSLTIGRYLLKVTITDQQASRVAEATVPIQIVAQ